MFLKVGIQNWGNGLSYRLSENIVAIELSTYNCVAKVKRRESVKMIICRLLEQLEKHLDPEKYAKKIGVKIGENCRIGMPNWGSEPYLISIGNHVTISCDVIFLTHDGATWCFREREEYKGVNKYGRVCIGDNCFIGCRSTIMPGVIMGNNSVLGAHSLLTKSIPAGEVWAGVPAHYLMTIDEYARKCKNGKGHVKYENENKRETLIRYFNTNLR